jgi:hypothetical protein
MITLITGLGALILALISVISFLFKKNQASQATAGNQAVVNQVGANDAQIAANQAAAAALAAQTAAQEKGETNESIISDLNSNTPKS